METVQTILYFLTIAIVFGTGIVTLAYNYKSKINRIFFYYLLATTLWLVALYASLPIYPGYTSLSITVASRLAYAGATLFSYFMVIFLSDFVFKFEELSFPFGKTKNNSWYKVVKQALTLETIVLTFLCVFTPLIYDHVDLLENGFTDNFGPLVEWSSIHHYIYFAIASLIPLFKIFHAKGLARKKLLMTYGAFISCYGVTIVCNVFLPTFGVVDYYLLGGIATAPFALITVYIIIQYRFLGTNIAFWKSFRTICALSISILFIIGIDHYVLQLLSPQILRIASLCFFSVGTYYLLNSVVFRNFYLGGNFTSFHNEIQHLIESLKFTEDFQSFAEKMRIAFTKKLGIASAEIFLTGNYIQSRRLPSYPDNELVDWLKEHRQAIVTEELKFSERALQDNDYKVLVHLSLLNAYICIPLFYRSTLIGFLIFGRKKSSDPYNQEEIHDFMILSDYIATFLVNDSLQHEGEQKNEEIIRSQVVYKDNERAKRLMHDMKNSLQSALAVVREVRENANIGNVWRIEESLWDLEDSLTSKSDQLNKKIVPTKDFFESIYNSSNDLFKEKHIELTWKGSGLDETFLYIDRSKMRRVFENLLHNAYKFTPEYGAVDIFVKYAQTHFEIDLINSGKGIPVEQKVKIFEKGFTTDTNRGSGIGLMNVKEYIELHGGSVKEMGTPGRNAHFHIILPVEEPTLQIFSVQPNL